MSLKKRHKYMLTALGIYWPTIFVLTHIPLPQDLMGRMGMSDKTLHFLAYLALVSLAWFAVSPFEKVDWRKPKVWIILAAIAWYGAFDEWLQGFVGRTPDIKDFYADIGAAFTALLIMTFFSFWPAVLVLTTFFMFSITCLTRVNIAFMNEHANSAFYFLSYCFFTLVWIQSSQRIWNINKSQMKWVASSIAVPAVTLTSLTLAAYALGKNVSYIDILNAMTAIIVTVITSYITCAVTQKCGAQASI